MPCLPPTAATSVAVVVQVTRPPSLTAPADAIGARPLPPSKSAKKPKRRKIVHAPKAERAKPVATHTPSPAKESTPRPTSTSPPPPAQSPTPRAMTLPPQDPFELPRPLTPTQDQYTLHFEIGRGSCGTVYLGTDEENLLVAIKLVPRGSAYCCSNFVQEELQKHHSVSYHPHVISFKEALVTNSYLCLVMEYANGGNMRQFLDLHPSGLPEDTVRRFFQQLMLAVEYCHLKHVHVRDIKLENILLQQASPDDPSWLVKLCDFGCSKASQVRIDPDSVASILPYMAPEVLHPTVRAEPASGAAADMWSCGIILYALLSGQFPYGDPPAADPGNPLPPTTSLGYISTVVQMAGSGVICLPAHVHVSEACKDLLYKLLDPSPDSRIRMEGVFRHPWFATGLPAGFLTFNQHLRSQEQVTLQTHEDIRRVVARAQYFPLLQQLSRGSSSSHGY